MKHIPHSDGYRKKTNSGDAFPISRRIMGHPSQAISSNLPAIPSAKTSTSLVLVFYLKAL